MRITASGLASGRMRTIVALMLAITLGLTGMFVAYNARANTPPVELNYLCVNPGGVVRYATTPTSCGGNETLITLPDDAPVTLCAASANSSIKDVTLSGGTCPSGRITIQIPSPTPVFFCAHKNNGKLSLTGDPPNCKKNEFPVFANSAPDAENDGYATDEDTTLNVSAPGVLANDEDPDGGTLAAELVDGTTNGLLTLNGNGSFEYIPNTNFNGSDSFTYIATDGENDSNVATVTITVNPINDVPVAVGDTYGTDEDTNLNVGAPGVLGNDTDADGTALTATLVIGPQRGSLTLNADGSFSYSPNLNFSGGDAFTYTASDGQAPSAVTTVTLLVNDTNDPPVTNNDAYSVNEDATLTVVSPGVLGNDNDPDGTSLSAALGDNVDNGTLALSADGSFIYTPNANYSGSDSFTYTASDGSASSAPATVTITVVAVNDPPTTGNDSYSAIGNTTLTVGTVTSPAGPVVALPGSLLDGDSDPDLGPNALSVVAATNLDTPNGTVTIISNGTFTYLPDAGFTGVDTFTYTLTDGAANVTGNVEITVTQVVWYLNGTAASEGDGRSSSPYKTLEAYTASAADEAGDFVFLYSSASAYGGGITLLDNQQLLGEPAGLWVAGTQLVALGGANPVISNTGGNGDGITLGLGNIIRAVDVANTSDDAISGGAVGALVIDRVGVSDAEDGLSIAASSGTSTVTVTDSSFGNLERDGISAIAQGATLNLTVQNSDFADAGNGDNAVSIRSGGAATIRFNVTGNTITSNNTAILVQANDTSDVQGTLDDNLLASSDGNGISVASDDNADTVVAVTNNTVTGSGLEGIFGIATNSADLDLTLTGNTVATSDDVFTIGLNSIYLLVFDDAVTCADISGNTAGNGTGLDPYDTGIHIEQYSSVAVGLNGYGSGDAGAFLAGQNTATASASGSGGFTGGSCAAPAPLP